MLKRPPRRVVIGALVAIVVLIAAEVGVNIYINTEYLPRLVGGMRPGLALQYGFAWTLWPGTVHVENLSVRGEEPGFDWQVSARRASVSARISSLADDAMRLDRLTLSGVRARLKPKPPTTEATPEVRLSPERRRALEPWRLVVEQVRVHDLEELWIDQFRFEGRLDSTGSFEFGAGRVARFGSTEVTVREGRLSIDDRLAAEKIRGRAKASLGPVDLYGGRGLALLATTSAEASIDAQVRDLGFLRELPGLPSPLEFEGGRGPAHLALSMNDGRLQPGTEATWSSDALLARIDGFEGRGAVSVQARIQLLDGEPRLRARTTFNDAQLGRPSAPPLMKSESVEFELDAPRLDLHRVSSFTDDLSAAWAQWPARIVLKHPTTSGQQRALQWWASFGRVAATIDLSRLKEHRIALRTAEIDGARVRIRPRVQKPEATSGYLALLAPIHEVPEPLCTEAAAPSLSERAAQSRWSIELDQGAVTDLQEVWLEAYRFEGRASARGGFRYGAGGVLETTSVHTKIEDGTLRIARWKAAKQLKGEIEARLSSTDLDLAEGYGFFRGLSSRADVQGELEQVEFLRHYPNLPVPAELGGGRGPMVARVALVDGVVQTGSTVHWESPSAQAATHGYRVVGPLTLDARWSDVAGSSKMRLDARISPYRVTRVGSNRGLVGGNVLAMRMEAPAFDLARPSFEPFTSVQVVDGHVQDLRVLNAYVPSNLPLKLEEGSGTFTGKVAWSRQAAATAELKVGGKQAEFAYDKLRLKGDWSVEAQLGNVNLTTADGEIVKATVRIDDMVMREGSRSRGGWFGRFDVSKGRVRPGQKVLLEADIDTILRDGRPLIAFFLAETDMLPAWVRSVVTLQGMHATARVRLGDGLLEVDGLNARGQSMEILGQLRKEGQAQRGDLLVRSRGQEVGVAVRGARFELKLFGAANWYREQLINPRW